MIIFAKGVTSGYLPLGGVVVSGRVAEPFWGEPGGPVFRHGATYAGHATCCAAALANLDLLEPTACSSAGRSSRAADEALTARRPEAPSARSAAAWGCCARRRGRSDPPAVVKAARAEGVLVRATATAVAVSPPLTATPEHFDLIAEALPPWRPPMRMSFLLTNSSAP